MTIEVVSPELEAIVSPDAPVTGLGSGYGGENGPAEGPLWWHEGGYLLFSDIHNNRRMKGTAQDGVSLFSEPTNRANGLTRDPSGRLLACEHLTRRVTRQEPDGSITVVASNYRGRRLNRPNDVIVSTKGDIYFTDPGFPAPGLDLDWNGVYHVTPDLGTITLIVWDFSRPNGLALSPDESVLYINDSRVGLIKAWDVRADGGIENGRLLCVLADERPGVPDGMKCDLEGNIYVTGPGGVWILAPDGRHLGTVALGDGKRATNVGFGGGDWKTLYITTFEELCRVRVNIPGVPVPRII